MPNSHLNATHRVASCLVRAVVLTGLVVLATLLAQPVDAQQRIFGSATVPYGQGYSGWTADWLRFVFDHTFDDLTSEPHCRPSGVHSRVWFITPLFSPGETVVTCQLPPGVSLFLPLLWAECSTVEDPGPFGCSDEASCRACAEAFIDGASDLSATIDGTSVDVSRLRFGSPFISYNLPDSNIFGLADGTPIQSVGDGYYLIIKPLSVGHHVVRLTGGSADLGFFNTTVRVQVAP